jgi:hypothetical protein
MDTPDGGAYWGAMGRSIAWDKYFENGSQGPPPMQILRFTGGSFYAGVTVMLLAAWAGMQSLRRKSSIFSLFQRRWLRFRMGVGAVSLLLAFGRYAPFYRLVYALPYVSTIRNPTKFLHLLSFALVALFAYGVDGLWRGYMQAGRSGKPALPWAGMSNWWPTAATFEKRWILGCLAILFLSILAWGVYGFSRPVLARYLQTVQFDEFTAQLAAAFSIRQVGWFILFFIFSAGAVALILSGAFAGARAIWGCVLLGVLLAADLVRANQPWIVYWDSNLKYASNSVVDELRQRPYEHRVAILPYRIQAQPSKLEMLYKRLWLPHLFPYYNIQSLDLVQLPRVPEDIVAFEQAFRPSSDADIFPGLKRHWQMTNTRYLLGPAAFANVANKGIDPAHPLFHLVQRFELAAKPGIDLATNEDEVTTEPAANGQFALFEFSSALPRAKLYPNWQMSSSDAATLTALASASFDPERTVLVSRGPPPPAPAAQPETNQTSGIVEIEKYAPSDILLKASAAAPSVLLLNDRFDPNWKVLVDGRPETLLRCNYIMRGVHLAPGAHTVEFRFQPPVRLLYVSLAAIGLGLITLGFVAFAPRLACAMSR